MGGRFMVPAGLTAEGEYGSYRFFPFNITCICSCIWLRVVWWGGDYMSATPPHHYATGSFLEGGGSTTLAPWNVPRLQHG